MVEVRASVGFIHEVVKVVSQRIRLIAGADVAVVPALEILPIGKTIERRLRWILSGNLP